MQLRHFLLDCVSEHNLGLTSYKPIQSSCISRSLESRKLTEQKLNGKIVPLTNHRVCF